MDDQAAHLARINTILASRDRDWLVDQLFGDAHDEAAEELSRFARDPPPARLSAMQQSFRDDLDDAIRSRVTDRALEAALWVSLFATYRPTAPPPPFVAPPAVSSSPQVAPTPPTPTPPRRAEAPPGPPPPEPRDTDDASDASSEPAAKLPPPPTKSTLVAALFNRPFIDTDAVALTLTHTAAKPDKVWLEDAAALLGHEDVTRSPTPLAEVSALATDDDRSSMFPRHEALDTIARRYQRFAALGGDTQIPPAYALHLYLDGRVHSLADLHGLRAEAVGLPPFKGHLDDLANARAYCEEVGAYIKRYGIAPRIRHGIAQPVLQALNGGLLLGDRDTLQRLIDSARKGWTASALAQLIEPFDASDLNLSATSLTNRLDAVAAAYYEALFWSEDGRKHHHAQFAGFLRLVPSAGTHFRPLIERVIKVAFKRPSWRAAYTALRTLAMSKEHVAYPTITVFAAIWSGLPFLAPTAEVVPCRICGSTAHLTAVCTKDGAPGFLGRSPAASSTPSACAVRRRGERPQPTPVGQGKLPGQRDVRPLLL